MKFVFYIFKVFAWFISLLPFSVLYKLSGIFRVFLQYVIRYRRNTILNNLSSSFPHKSNKEIKEIMGQFYCNLADIFLEVIKLQRMSREEFKDRFSFTGFELLSETFSSGRSVIVSIGHCGNWEWLGTALLLRSPVKGFAVVKPLADKNFHYYLESLRHRLNPGSTIPFQQTYRALIRNKKEMVTLNLLAADQTPTRAEKNYWARFLNQDTPFYMGVERLARSLDFSVVFIDIQRTGRGRYNGEIKLISENPKNTSDHEITDKYIQLLEGAICHQPDNWLWSHKRWKFSQSSPDE